MKNKITGTFVFLLFLFSLVIGKALYVQVINRDKLIAYSKSQIMRETKIFPKRGYIQDRNGNPVAINVIKHNLFTFAKKPETLKKELQVLKKILPKINVKKILASARKRKKFTWIARKLELTKDQVKEIKKLKVIISESLSSRFYPNHEIMSQVLGFVGLDNDGLAGIEYQFNDDLKGEPEVHKYFKDAKGRPVKFKSANFNKRAKDITLSIDKDIQADLEGYLKEGVEKHEALRGGAAVMDATTGEIWAMANYPTFDPNKIKKGSKTKLAFVSDPFEPGSVFKTITIAAALEENIVKVDTNYYCERGKYRVDNHYIKESDSNHRYEWLSVKDILKYSSNIGTTKIAFDVTFPVLKPYLTKFNIGKKTNIEFPGESRGILDKKENVSPLRLSNVSFGQGVATTGIQMLAAYSAFANGGYYVTPTLLKVKEPLKIKSRKIISAENSRVITEILKEAVDGGTGSKARIDHFEIAGKTSTAQRSDHKGKYNGYISGFIGYPINVDKRFIVYVYIDNPKKGYYGNQVAAPIFKKIAKSILYKNKEFNRTAKIKVGRKSNLDNLNLKNSKRQRAKKGISPNLVGLDKSSAFTILDSIDAKYSHTGFGIVSEQIPRAGAKISTNTIIKLKFKAPAYDQ